jgi:DNA primase
MRFTQDQIDQARDSVAMSKLVGKHVKLRKTGNEYSACCPVHKENRPSFTVNDHKGFAHCFGCGFHADPIKWLTDYENYSFHDAVTYLLGGDPKPGEQRIEQRQSIKQDHEPECVDSFVVAEHIIALTQPISGTIVEPYLRYRGIEPDLLRGYLDNLAFVPNCPLYSWRIEQGPRDVKTAPAMVAPIHQISRQNSMIHGERLVTKFIGAHVTYLASDGSGKLERFNRDGEKLASRKMYGEHQGGAILFTGMSYSDAPLVEGEGLESTLCGALFALRQTPIIRLAATLSLNNHQGYVIEDNEGAIPLFDPRIDQKKKCFGFERPGHVMSLVDADMNPHNVKVRRGRLDEVEIGLARPERTMLCERLLKQKWAAWGAYSHSCLTPPDGMDFNDHWRDVNETA